MNVPKISNLQKTQNERIEEMNGIYKVVLKKCNEKIIHTSKHSNKSFTIFQVPKLLIGQPMYNIKSCIYYIIHELSKNGYYIEYIEPYFIYIDWGSNIISKETSLELLKLFPNVKNIEYIYKD